MSSNFGDFVERNVKTLFYSDSAATVKLLRQCQIDEDDEDERGTC